MATAYTCEHLSTQLGPGSPGRGQYEMLLKRLVYPRSPVERVLKSQKQKCAQCDSTARVHACLLCVHFGCYGNGHIQGHVDAAHPAGGSQARLSVDLSSGQVYCHDCSDYRYDLSLLQMLRQCRRRAFKSLGVPNFFEDWIPSEEFLAVLAKNRLNLRVSTNQLLGLRGLVNLGNTCFMSCIVQALVHTPVLRDFFLLDPHSSLREHPALSCLVCEFARLFREFYSDCDNPFVPSSTLHLIWCLGCDSVSRTIDPFWDISLDMNTLTSESQTLGCSLERYIAPEHLGKIRCFRCQTVQDSIKQLTFRKLPVVACFHFKRFQHACLNHRKISTHISFPELLDMTPFMSSKANHDDSLERLGKQYRLFCVVNHSGSLSAGHYTCYVRHNCNTWYKCDDHQISDVPVSEVLTSEGYLLFYHKVVLDYHVT
uniref:Ubiquitin carboxyl-terminal hydrolase n=1 Tax=Macrostomum lignano TaxID=282301 RepID=A0A1I8GXK8_9PLAT